MKALWGTVSLLVALAIVGLTTVRHLGAVGRVPQAPLSGFVEAPSASAGGNVSVQARTIERQVADDVAKALKQGADSRADPSEAPGAPEAP